MKCSQYLSGLIILFLSLTNIQAAEETQVWQEQIVTAKIHSFYSAGFWTQQRLSTTEPGFRRNEVAPFVIMRPATWLDAMVGVALARYYVTETYYSDSQLAVMALTPKYAIDAWSFSSRQRIDWGDYSGEELMLFRQCTKVSWKLPVTEIPIHLFVYDEWHYDITGDYMRENRAVGGVALTFCPEVTIEFAGMRHDVWDARGRNKNYPVAMVNLKLNF